VSLRNGGRRQAATAPTLNHTIAVVGYTRNPAMKKTDTRTMDDGRWTMGDASSIVHRPSSIVTRLAWGLPLGWQLSALYALLLLVTLSLVGSLVYSQQESFLVQDAGQRLVQQASRIAALPQPGPRPDEGQPQPGDHRD